MSSVMTRMPHVPASRRGPKSPRATGTGLGALITGALAGLGAAAAGLTVLGALIGLAWIVEPAVGGSVLGPARLSAQAWLLGHGSHVETAGVVVAITPLGLTVLLAVCCWYAACWAGRRAEVGSLRDVVRVLAPMAVTYSAIGVLLLQLGSSAGADIPLSGAVSGVASLSAFVGLAGLLRTAGHGRLIHDVLPFPSRAVLSGVGAGAAVLFATGLGTLAIAIATDRAGFAALTESLAPNWSAGIGLFAMSLLLLPNAAVYAVALLLGPGFAVGAGTTVSAFGVTLGLVPGLPIAAALPDDPAVPLGAIVALMTPALCAVLVGAVVTRRLDEGTGAAAAAGWAAAAGLALAVAIAAAQWLAAGSLGDDRLATIGAPPLATLVVAAAVLAPLAALSAFVLRRWQTRG
ncbi:MAG: DUF6350 family protein [Actinomycetota bacterium]|nr:DUF6350 family protein [Actinomycetota bacterium]